MILLTLAAVFAGVTGAGAQKLAIGAKAPELQVAEWLNQSPDDGKARLIDFFHTSSDEAVSLLEQMNAYAAKFDNRLAVIIIAREEGGKVSPVVLKDSPKYHAALDEGGKTFAGFGVTVVPFGVITDARGKVLWFGNPTQLDEQVLEKLLE